RSSDASHELGKENLMHRRFAAVALLASGLAAGLVLGGVAQAQAPATAGNAIGYVDTQQIFRDYKTAQEAQTRFRKEAQEYQEELAEDQKKLEEARKANKSEAELNAMQKKFEDDLKPKKARVEKLDRDLSSTIKKEIEAA